MKPPYIDKPDTHFRKFAEMFMLVVSARADRDQRGWGGGAHEDLLSLDAQDVIQRVPILLEVL